jgi:hypothetical protein
VLEKKMLLISFGEAIDLVRWIVVLQPLWQLYLRGPSIRGFGFWGGKLLPDICHALTDITTAHWYLHPKECVRRVVDHFVSLTTAMCLLGYIFAVYRMVKWFLFVRFFLNPLQQQQEQICLLLRSSAAQPQYPTLS